MLPFTQEMYDVYQKYMSNSNEIEHKKFEYNFALGQLDDDSTTGDYGEVEYLCDALRTIFTKDDQKLFDDYCKCLQDK